MYVDSNREAANKAIAALFRSRIGQEVTRAEIVACAPGHLDPLKRVRRNGGARDILDREGIEIVWLGGHRFTAKERE